jgi:hypothetical protein
VDAGTLKADKEIIATTNAAQRQLADSMHVDSNFPRTIIYSVVVLARTNISNAASSRIRLDLGGKFKDLASVLEGICS